MPERSGYVLTLDCPDSHGIVYAVSGFLYDHDSNIVESQQFGDETTDRFFMRVHFDSSESRKVLAQTFAPIAERLGMRWELWDYQARPRTIVMVSKEGHCLNDLLYRWSIDSLPIDIVAVVSNHTSLEPLARAHGVPFHHVPTDNGTAAAEDELRRIHAATEADLVVLARYMQIISADLCRDLAGRIINIHHSFLPSFKGAKPYRQAFDHGVKLVGATAHYVTADLDEGPIIEQDVTRVDHNAAVEDLAAAGRDVECQVLSRAVRWHAEHRILLNDHRTVVFR